jgi:hypothetical protein
MRVGNGNVSLNKVEEVSLTKREQINSLDDARWANQVELELVQICY